ncbi:MAG: hypothetical protein HYU28_11930 [Actinobacteria bacterium]|nr:hypothetical protein [Actinomycetota bacterium]
MADAGPSGAERPSKQAPLDRAIELFVYAPIGVLQFARDLAPPVLDQLVERGRDRVEELQKRAENQIGQFRIMGQFATAQFRQQFEEGRDELLREIVQRGEQVARLVGLSTDRDAEGTSDASDAGSVSPVPAAASPNGARGDARRPNDTIRPNGASARELSLPIPDYDELSASQVVARLTGLEPDQLEAIRDYETGSRQRKTILTRIEQIVS